MPPYELVHFFLCICCIHAFSHLALPTDQVELVHVLQKALDHLEIVFDVEVSCKMTDLCNMSDLRLTVHEAMTPLDDVLFTQFHQHFVYFLLFFLDRLSWLIFFHRIREVCQYVNPVLIANCS